MATYEEGHYIVRVIGQGFGELPNEKRTPYFFIQVEPIGMVNPADPTGALFGCEAYARTVNLYLTEKAIDFSLQRLYRLGWQGQSFVDLDGDSPVHSFAGQQIELVCRHDHSGGKTYDNWEFPPLDSQPVKSDPAVAKRLDALYGEQLRKAAAVKPEPTSEEQPQESAGEYIQRETAVAAAGPDCPF